MWFSGFFPLILSVIVEVYLWWKLQASHLFKWENLHNWWLTKYLFAPLYSTGISTFQSGISHSFKVLAHFIKINWHSRQCSQSQSSFYLYHCTSYKLPAEGDHFESIFTFTLLLMFTNSKSSKDPTLELWYARR